MSLEKTKSPKDAAVQGFWLGYFVCFAGFYWIAYVLQEFGGLPWVVSVLGFLLFCLLGQPQFLISSFLIKKQVSTKPNNSSLLHPFCHALLITFIYTGLDWALPKLFIDTLGHAFYKASYLRQVADFSGVFLLTFLAVFVNYGTWLSIRNWQENRKIRLNPTLLAGLLCTVLCWSYGFFRYKEIHNIINSPQPTIQVAAIQANIGDIEKLAAEQGIKNAATTIINTFIKMSSEALTLQNRPDFIIWPETSYPTAFRNPRTLSELTLDSQIEGYVKKQNIPLLFGGYDHVQGKDFNAFFMLPTQGALQTYHKSILLLFGEYIPGADFFPFIKDMFPQVGNFGRGNGPETFEVPLESSKLKSIRISPMICYEALFSSYGVESARQGSQLIVNVTNDSWFGLWGEPQLHLALSTFRSIETRLPMIRATNTGFSALITATGEITHQTTLGSPEILNVSIPITPPISTMVRTWGDWFGPFSLAMGILGLLIQTWSTKFSRRKH